MDEKPLRFEDLRLTPGQVLQLDFDGYTTDRDRSLLIGYRSGQSIIVTTPQVSGSPMMVKLNTGLTVRLFAPQMNCACAFRTEVLHVSRAPYSHLHLAMPKELVLGEVRSAVRAKVDLDTQVVFGVAGEHQKPAIIRDLSLGGARLEAEMMPVVTGEHVVLNSAAQIAGIQYQLALKAIVRSLTSDKGKLIIGVQFESLPDADHIALHAYVMSHV